MNIQTILEQAVSENASDVFIVAGLPVSVRKNGVIHQVNEEKLLPSDTESLLKRSMSLPTIEISIFLKKMEMMILRLP